MKRLATMWLVRIGAGVSLGVIVFMLLRPEVFHLNGRLAVLAMATILFFVAWFESKDRKKFEDDFFGGDDDPRGGPPGFA